MLNYSVAELRIIILQEKLFMFRLLQILLNMFIWRQGIISILKVMMVKALGGVDTLKLEQ